MFTNVREYQTSNILEYDSKIGSIKKAFCSRLLARLLIYHSYRPEATDIKRQLLKLTEKYPGILTSGAISNRVLELMEPPWKQKEEIELLALWNKGNSSYEISTKLGRSQSSITKKVRQLRNIGWLFKYRTESTFKRREAYKARQKLVKDRKIPNENI